MNLRHVASLAAFVSALGCGAQPPAGVVEAGSSISRNGCTMNLKQICRSLFNQSEFTVNGVQYDTRRLEQNSPRHPDLVMNYRYPNGDPLAAVNCQLDMSTHAVTRADLASEPPLDDKAVEYVRSQGLCMEEAGLFLDSWRPSQGEYWMP
jgi:hypothetical protein